MFIPNLPQLPHNRIHIKLPTIRELVFVLLNLIFQWNSFEHGVKFTTPVPQTSNDLLVNVMELRERLVIMQMYMVSISIKRNLNEKKK